MSAPLKIGHRGASGSAPENTFAAFDLALAQGAGGLEFDIQISSDGVPVVIHDDTLERTTDGKGRVCDFTFEQLQKLDAGRGEKIPAYGELLARYAGRCVLFTEIKAEAAIQPIAALISQHGAQRGIGYDRLPVIGFEPSWQLAIKRVNPHIVIGTTPPEDRPIPKGFCAQAKAQGFSYLTPNIRHLRAGDVAEAHAHGLQLVCWTANRWWHIRKAKRLGVDGIMSDWPARL